MAYELYLKKGGKNRKEKKEPEGKNYLVYREPRIRVILKTLNSH